MVQTEQEECLLSSIKIYLSSECKSEAETSTGSMLSLYTISLPTSPINSPFSYPRISQYNYPAIIKQLQEQLAAQQAQIQALLEAGTRAEREVMGSNMGSQMEVAKPPIFNREARKVEGFITACKLYLRMKMREATVEEQVQWILSYVQGGSVL